MMPIYRCFWTPENEEHLAEHDVTRQEFEDVVSNPKRVQPSHEEGRIEALGMTSTGRFLCCVYEDGNDGGYTIIPVTAFELED